MITEKKQIYSVKSVGIMITQPKSFFTLSMTKAI